MVLVDPSAPAECCVVGDHVEVRLALILPVDHPVVAAAFPPPPGAEPPAPLALRSDIKSLIFWRCSLASQSFFSKIDKSATKEHRGNAIFKLGRCG